jgi:hypothetical protein
MKWIDKEWKEEISGALSQLYRKFKVEDVLFTAYLRFRHDFWEFYIFTGDMEEMINVDLFDEHNFAFREYEIHKAKKTAEFLLENIHDETLKTGARLSKIIKSFEE